MSHCDKISSLKKGEVLLERGKAIIVISGLQKSTDVMTHREVISLSGRAGN